MERWLEGWQGKLLLVLLSVCLTCLLASAVGEVYIRLTRPYTTPDTRRQASLQYEATLFSRHAFPQMEQSADETHTGEKHINSRGYRGRDFLVPKPDGTVRIVLLGGSAGFDTHAPVGRDWPHLVEENLHTLGYENVEVINAATPGHATWDSLGRLYAEIWMFEPDYVIVYHAWNDIKYFGWLSPARSLLRGYHPASTSGDQNLWVGNPFMYYTGPVDRLLCHSQLYVRLRSRYWSWRLGKIGLEGVIGPEKDELPMRSAYPDSYDEWGPQQYELNLRLIADAARDIGARPVFLTQARLVTADNSPTEKQKISYHYVGLSHQGLVQAFEDCDEAVLNAAKAEDVDVLDLSERLSGQSEFFVDQVHTTPVGSEAIAQAVAGFLNGLMEDKE